MSLYSLSKLRFTRPYFSVFDCILNDKQAIYCSSELTSGLRTYEELRKRGLKSAPELKKELGDAWYQKNIWEANVQAANKFAASVLHEQTDGTAVITPAPFWVPDWDQPEYLAFWEELIRTRVKAVRFNRNWEFSNGCTFEFVVALDAGIRTLDSDGNALEPGAAVACVEAAVEQLENNFDTPKLRDNLQQMRSLGGPPPADGMNHYPSHP
jgi:hypothetical protein